MDNVFSKLHVTRDVRMYATKNGKQRYYGNDLKYFISYNIPMKEDHYTICGASGTGFYSYAVLDMYGATIDAGYCGNEFIQIDKSDNMRYIVVCGEVSKLESLMILNAPKSEVGTTPEYKPCDEDEGGGGGGGSSKASATLLAQDFVWDENRTYTIHSFVNSYVDELSDLPNDFVVYIDNADHIAANAVISLFGVNFDLYHVNGNVIEHTIESVPNVLPIMFSKSAKKARMLYSYTATVQTGLGLEDIYLDLD